MEPMIQTIRDRFTFYKTLGDQTFVQLPEQALFWQYNTESNSIASIVKHIWGNALSRWTDFLETDGEKPWRKREAEFDNDLRTKTEVLKKWEAGWQCLFQTIDSLTPENMLEVVYIRNQAHSVFEALLRSLSHYSYHVGQIVYLGKLQAGKDWQSLSIPRGDTEPFNAAMFSRPRKYPGKENRD